MLLTYVELTWGLGVNHLNPCYLLLLLYKCDTDVIGHVVEVSHVEMISVNGKETQKISLELRDLA